MASTLRAVPPRAITCITRLPATVSKRTTRTFGQSVQRDAIPSRGHEREEVPASLNLSEMPSMAHAELETHREIRAMARTAAWEMPLLSALSKPFEPPTEAVPLRWRYTTYFGELHPAANKVVVEFGIADLKQLDEAQRSTLRKIAGTKWDPATDMIKMSCESFPNQAQNKRYLGETIANLIKEAIEGKDKFEDVPVDDRHAVKRTRRRQRASPVARFPKEWYITPERRAYLDSIREAPAAQIEAPAQTDEQAMLAALKQAAVDAGEMSPEAAAEVPVYASAQKAAPLRQAISGFDAIEAARQIEAAKANQIQDNTPGTQAVSPSRRGRR